MDEERIAKRLQWLEDLRRQDAELVSRLSERVEKAEASLGQQTKLFQDLATGLARIDGQVARINQFDAALTKLRQDVNQQIENAEERKRQREKGLEQSLRTDISQMSAVVQAMQVEIKKAEGVEESIQARREEELRLNKAINNIDERMDQLTAKEEVQKRSIVSLEEAQGNDAHRIAELQSETTDLRTKIEKIRGGQDIIEDRLKRVEDRADTILAGEAGRDEALALWEEKQELRHVEFERTWKSWEERLEHSDALAAELEKRMLQYDETYRSMERVREALDHTLGKMERRIGEITEMQRLVEERIRQEWTSFQADDQKRWNTYKLTYDEQWREHTRQHEKTSVDISDLKDQAGDMQRVLADLAELSTSRVTDLLAIVREWAADMDSNLANKN